MREDKTTHTTEEKWGLKFLRPEGPYRDFDTLRGKRRFGNLAKDPDFRDTAGFSEAVDDLPTVEVVDLETTPDGKTDLGNYKVVRNSETKAVYDVVSQQYAPVDYRDIFHPLVEACQKLDLHVAGEIDTWDDGANIQTNAVFANPDFEVELLTDYEDGAMLGFQVRSSHNRHAAVKLTPFAIRTVCVNYNLWGNWMPSHKVEHRGDPEAIVGDIEDFLEASLEAIPPIQEKMQEAFETGLERGEVLTLLLGAGMPQRHFKKAEPLLERLEPISMTKGHSAWTAYNAMTAYYTWAHHSDRRPVQNKYLGKATTIVDDPEATMEQGREVVQGLQEKLAEQKADPETRQTVPEVIETIEV